VTEYSSVEELSVLRDGARVATLRRLPKGCSFRYTEEFLRSEERAIALHLPKTAEDLVVEGIANLPTYFAGLLPEGVMFRAVQTQIGSAADDLFAMLAATGYDTVGDIDVGIPGVERKEPPLSLGDAREIIGLLLRGEKLKRGPLPAIAGVQPKLSLGELVRSSRTSQHIIKFDPPEYPNLSENEHALMRLARRCRVEAADTRLEDRALIVKRFDRIYDKGSKKINRVHVEDMLQVMDRFPNSKYALEYSELVGAMRGLAVSQGSLLSALRLYVFSYIIGNGDLHAKNVSVVYEKEHDQWRISPAYDLLSTLPYGSPLMALALDDEAFGRFTVRDFVEVGRKFGLAEKAVRQMIGRTSTAVLEHAPGLLDGVLSPEVVGTILERARELAAADTV
jgi:serine/threonine-protein kinase HipA